MRNCSGTTRRYCWARFLAVASLAFGCSDTQEPNQTPLDPGPFIVSSPVEPVDPFGPGSESARLDQALVYISLPPAAAPTGVTATIRNPHTGGTATAPLVDGGFDPVALPAAAGDTIAIAIQTTDATSPLVFRVVVAPGKRPAVVRTSPPRHKRDVALNSIVVIVFSGPLDPATVDTGSVRLWRGTTPVAGTVRFADASHLRVEFRPDSLLRPQADYELVLGATIRDLNGLALGSSITVPFTTGTVSGPISLSIGGSVSGLAGAGLVLHLNTGEDLPVTANGPIAFNSALASGEIYIVTVANLPSNPGQLCVVARGEGTLADSGATDVAVNCSGPDPSVSGKILFTKRDPGPDQIFVLDLDQLAITQLTSGSAYNYTPQWSPDRSRIAFIRNEGGFAYGLWVMQADGSGADELVWTPGGGSMSFGWSPDGTRLVFFAGRVFGRINANGSRMVLTDSLLGTSYSARPAVSPDGSTIAFAGDCFDWCVQTYLMDADGSNVRRLTSQNTYGGMDVAEGPPAWSPDGTHLAFWSPVYGITVVNRDGMAAFSASGEVWPRPGGEAMWPAAPSDAAPDWSPDGTHLVFQMKGQLFVTRADGTGTPRQLTSMTGGAFDPAWLK